MNKLFSILIAMLLVLSVIPVLAVETGSSIGLDITPEAFPPHIWMCDSRIVSEDCVEEGRMTDCADKLVERVENYAFEGEQIQWDVLVMDKNKIQQITDVVGTVGEVQGEGNDIEVECVRSDPQPTSIDSSCNARIDEEALTTFDPDTMAYYTCTLTVETSDSMYGNYWLTVEAIGSDGEATMDENEYWFLNPVVALKVDGDISFDNVRPGAVSYSDTILVENDADEGSGVLMDMFISGTDFYDSTSSGALCPTSNRLKLSRNGRSQAYLGADTARGIYNGADYDCNTDKPNQNIGGALGLTDDNADHICYYATNGAYDTSTDVRADAENYVPIVYGDAFTRDFYNDAEIIQDGTSTFYSPGNVLSPGAEIALTFKLGLPEPCVGDFDEGQIYFWGEAV